MSVLALLRRMLGHRVSIAALIEVAVWSAGGYLLIGLTLTFTHPDYVSAVQQQMQARVPQSVEFELVAFGVTTALWPAMLVPTPGCPR